ncbi:hypothetical protein SOVF_187350 [Spinacia oleracea]|nr:hypothetical protein SOVF_187350 [Spinacia oleracea]
MVEQPIEEVEQPVEQPIEEVEQPIEEVKSFKELNICDSLIEACNRLGWTAPTKIQADSIPHALEGKDIIGLAQTGSGKTGAFALPIIQAFLDENSPQPFFGCVLSPTRELAFQIAEQFEALGASSGLRTAVVESDSKYSTADTLQQQYLFIPAIKKDCYLVYILSEMSGSTMIFTQTCDATGVLALMLRNLGFRAIPINGQMPQNVMEKNEDEDDSDDVVEIDNPNSVVREPTIELSSASKSEFEANGEVNNGHNRTMRFWMKILTQKKTWMILKIKTSLQSFIEKEMIGVMPLALKY